MEEEPVRLGRISRTIEKTLDKDFGDEIWIFILSRDLDSLANRWPKNYIARIEEAGRIIKKPDYVAYLEEGKTLYLIKEYFKEGVFKKVLLEIVFERQWHLKGIRLLEETMLKEIIGKSQLKRVISN